MTEQRQEFKPTQDWTVLSLVFDFDANHPKSHGVNKYGPWTVRTVKDEKGTEYSFFTSGNLMELLDHLEINKKGNRFQIRKCAAIDEKTDKPYSFFEIRTANGEFNTKVGAVPAETEVNPAHKGKAESPTATKSGNGALGEPHPDIDLALDRYKYLVIGFRKKILEIKKECELTDEQVVHLFDKSHIQTLLNSLK